MQKQASVLLCTVGTSLEKNLEKWRAEYRGDAKNLNEYTAEDLDAAAQYIGNLDPNTRPCGAEINSIQALLDERHVIKNPQIHLFHSDTENGIAVAQLLKRVLGQRGPHWSRVELDQIGGLRDSDPRQFRTQGLRNLVRSLCDRIKTYGCHQCAINATGGYKAQIAIAVMIGQALGVRVYYKHEFFAQQSIISFPPLPIALDEKVWLDNMSFFHELYDADDFVPAKQWSGELDEVLESLIERERQQGEEFLILSPAGEILHEKFKDRQEREIPPLPKAQRKEPPHLSGEHLSSHQPKIHRHMKRVIDENSFVTTCRCIYTNPDLPLQNTFRMTRGNVTGIYSDGSICAKFIVDTTAEVDAQKRLAVGKLNQWLQASP